MQREFKHVLLKAKGVREGGGKLSSYRYKYLPRDTRAPKCYPRQMCLWKIPFVSAWHG